MNCHLEPEKVMKKEAHKSQDARAPEGSLAVPLEVQLEIALQNQRLAELRYNTSVQRGRAWEVGKRTVADAK